MQTSLMIIILAQYVLTNTCLHQHVFRSIRVLVASIFASICWTIFSYQDAHGKDVFSDFLHTCIVLPWARQYFSIFNERFRKYWQFRQENEELSFHLPHWAISPFILPVVKARSVICRHTSESLLLKDTFRYDDALFVVSLNGKAFTKYKLQRTLLYFWKPVSKQWPIIDIGWPTDDHLAGIELMDWK